MMYLITGATGNIGKAIALELLTKGKKIKLISRNAERLKELTAKGGIAIEGDVNDPDFILKAFEGVDAVFLMIPPNLKSENLRGDQHRITDNYVQAVKQHNIKNVILLSSIGAHLRNGAGVVDGLGYLEEEFSKIHGINVLNLRPAIFMENLFGMIDMIKHTGTAGSAIKADIKMPMVATKDIAEVAAKHLIDLKFKGNTIEYILGPRDLTYNEVFEVLGKAIGKIDLKYTQFNYEEAKNGMVQSGIISEDVAKAFIGLAIGVNDGYVLNAHKRTSHNFSPTSIEEFAKRFANLYNMKN